ncbi:MAG TPA: M48 family metalloprotease, partial [Rhizomicrobium sp.]|nr:M48 family metalloprotease [Rhizomicrobium sp.]
MRAIAPLALLALLTLSSSAGAGLFDGNGYPSKGRAIDALKPAADYGDALKGRPLALGIMRTRGQGFVPSPELQAYMRAVMTRLLSGVKLPPSFQPDVRVLATPEFAGECTPDGTLIVTVGLLEQLETEDELAFVIGHELAHAIYRHETPNWAKKAQYFAVVHGAAVDVVAQSAQSALGGQAGNNIMRGLDVAQHLAKLSANVLMPQMSKSQEDQADAL